MPDSPSSDVRTRRYPIGAETIGHDVVSFRVWAPKRRRVSVIVANVDGGDCDRLELAPETAGYFSSMRRDTPPGTLYWFQLDDEEKPYADPASRFQPQGHAGPSAVVDPDQYMWQDHGWRGVSRNGQVLYEMHVGTFTGEGTWRAAAQELPHLAQLGVTTLEVMPAGEFPGRFGWGYDVVHYFAPTRLYGTPDDMRAFVDAAHRAGLGVILDVVYNHCAAMDCILPAYSDAYFSRKYRSDWGHAINYDDAQSQPVREFFLSNVDYWIREFHLDGFRFDATQNIDDASPVHILSEMSARAHAAAAGRKVLLIGENEPQDTRLLGASARGGCGMDALWNDDFHHSARVAATGQREAYYRDYAGTPQEFISCAKRGFLYQGQHYAWQKKRRGTPTAGYTADRFVHFLQNHDQIANSARGLRLHELTTPRLYRTLTALLLLAPQTPLIFQGQEFAASAPFLYFADNRGEQARLCAQGRADFLRQFDSIAAGGDAVLCDPAEVSTFERCKLDANERDSHREALALHRDLLEIRRTHTVFKEQDVNAVDGAVLGESSFILRYFDGGGDDRLVVVNLGGQLELVSQPEPLLAPPQLREWALVWSSEDVAYGGDGTPPPDGESVWRVPAQCAVVFAARAQS